MYLIRAAEPIPAEFKLLQYILIYEKNTLQLPYVLTDLLSIMVLAVGLQPI